MPSWQHGATFVAFAVIAAMIVFAGHFHGASMPPGGAELAAVEK